MQKLFRCLLFVTAAAGVASPAAAGELTVTIADGRATVIAKDVPVRQILAEWARVGNTRIVNGEKVAGGPISLELIDVPEKDALDILLRSAAGYLAGPRPQGVPGASLYDRVMILATSRPPANTPMAPQPFNRPAVQQMPQPPPDDDDGEPGDQGEMPPEMMDPRANPALMNPGTPFQGQPGRFPGQNQNPPDEPYERDPSEAQPVQQPITSPRPGMLPQQPQPTQQGTPFGPFGQPGPAGRGGGPPVDPDPDDQ